MSAIFILLLMHGAPHRAEFHSRQACEKAASAYAGAHKCFAEIRDHTRLLSMAQIDKMMRESVGQ